ncbi:MAG: cyclohexanecarboxylate-CoA ligase, partial [Halieaceae bacterium]
MITSSDRRIASLTSSGAWGEETLHGLLAWHAASVPDKMAVSDQPNRRELTGDTPVVLTWKELSHAAASLATQLQGKGLSHGDRVVVQMPNVVELVVCYYACSQLGLIISPIPVQYGRHELEVIAQALEPSAVLTIERLRDQTLAANAREALPKIPVLVMGSELVLSSDFAIDPLNSVASDANQVLSLCWTSGTTGTPKGVPRTHNMWLATARCTIAAGDYRSDDILLNPFPMVNMAALGGFLFPAALLGCSIVLHHPLDPPLFLQQLQDQKISFTIAPPALLNQLAKSAGLW